MSKRACMSVCEQACMHECVCEFIGYECLHGFTCIEDTAIEDERVRLAICCLVVRRDQ